MFKRFYPKTYLENIYQIDFARLKKNGVAGLIFDIDNTIAPFDIPEPDDRITDFFVKLTGMGFKVCLLSNNNEGRVALFNKKLKLFAIHSAGKPKLSGINKALGLLGTTPDQTVLIGDQVFTDIWCGNRKGIYTVLVKPIAQRDEWTVRLKRGAEKIVVKAYLAYIKKGGQV
ncbi:MAG: YqeG family HAD IIIA-type phosphatase [Clostridiales bacterium]|jgi:HAD superfamily phosphatase (TIGR01668 family)|nr:YqeG family HAD IIIA-type phosphatase [Clostridiales bacterium]